MTAPLSCATFGTNELHRKLSAAVFALAALLTVVSEVSGLDSLARVAGVCLVVFIVLEFRKIGWPQKIAALVLLGVAMVVALRAGQLPEALGQGVLRTLPFLLIFTSVGWLRAAAMQSRSVQRLGSVLPTFGAGRRFAALALASHLIGAAFNLAGIGLLAPMLDTACVGKKDRQRLRCAILWGFAAAPCWSPFIVGTVAILSVFEGLLWIQVLPYGVALACGFLVWAVIWNRVFRTGSRAGPTPVLAPEIAAPAGQLLGVILMLFVVVFAVMAAAALPLTVAIALVAPIFALAWGRGAGKAAQGDLMRRVLAGYPGMRSETTVFAAANIFGAAVSSALAGEGIALSPGELTGWLYLDALLLLWGFLGVSAIGIHPVVSLVVFAALVDPSALGMPLPVLAAVMMACWGMGTSVSPLSGTTLLMAQLTGVSSFTIAWRWSGAFYAAACLWLALLITLAV